MGQIDKGGEGVEALMPGISNFTQICEHTNFLFRCLHSIYRVAHILYNKFAQYYIHISPVYYTVLFLKYNTHGTLFILGSTKMFEYIMVSSTFISSKYKFIYYVLLRFFFIQKRIEH